MKTVAFVFLVLLAAAPSPPIPMVPIPIPVSPASGSTLAGMEADLAWNLPMAAGATQVHLQVTPAHGDGPSVHLLLGAVESFRIPGPPAWYGLLPDMTYTWRVRTSPAPSRVDEHHLSWGPWSEPWTFRTPTATGSTISPKDPKDTGQFPGVLGWQDSNPGVWYYEVQVSRDAGFGQSAPLYWELRHGGITSPPRSYTPPSLEPVATYYWRVRPRVQGDGKPAPWSTASRFTTPAHRKVALADSGTTVVLRVGDTLEVDLGTDYQWTISLDDPRMLAQLPTMGLRAMPVMYRAQLIGRTTLLATGELPCHRASPPCLAPVRLFEVQVVVQARLVQTLAPIESATVRSDAQGYLLDVVQGLPEQYDLITTFDVVHDMANPRGALRAIRQALRPDGTYLMLEINCQDKLEENAGPLGALFYSASVLYCMTTSLVHGGEGLGTMGLPESKVRALCTEAGFSSIRRLPLENPFNTLYEITP